jgi:hypothetical protein
MLSFRAEYFFFQFTTRKYKVKIRRTVTLPVVLCGREALSLTLKDEHRLKVFENWVLREIFRLKRDEVRGEWRRLHNEKVYDLYSSLNIIWLIKSRKMRKTGDVTRKGKRRGAYRVFVVRHGGKRPLEKSRRRWQY